MPEDCLIKRPFRKARPPQRLNASNFSYRCTDASDEEPSSHLLFELHALIDDERDDGEDQAGHAHEERPIQQRRLPEITAHRKVDGAAEKAGGGKQSGEAHELGAALAEQQQHRRDGGCRAQRDWQRQRQEPIPARMDRDRIEEQQRDRAVERKEKPGMRMLRREGGEHINISHGRRADDVGRPGDRPGAEHIADEADDRRKIYL